MVLIELPPLREREEDIPLLANHFLKEFAIENNKEITGFSPDAVDFLLKYEWPGNVRELENTIERAVILAKSTTIEDTDLGQENKQRADLAPLEGNLKEIEKSHILRVLNKTNGNYSEAARMLQISRMTLYNKVRTYGLKVKKIDNG